MSPTANVRLHAPCVLLAQPGSIDLPLRSISRTTVNKTGKATMKPGPSPIPGAPTRGFSVEMRVFACPGFSDSRRGVFKVNIPAHVVSRMEGPGAAGRNADSTVEMMYEGQWAGAPVDFYGPPSAAAEDNDAVDGTFANTVPHGKGTLCVRDAYLRYKIVLDGSWHSGFFQEKVCGIGLGAPLFMSAWDAALAWVLNAPWEVRLDGNELQTRDGRRPAVVFNLPSISGSPGFQCATTGRQSAWFRKEPVTVADGALPRPVVWTVWKVADGAVPRPVGWTALAWASFKQNEELFGGASTGRWTKVNTFYDGQVLQLTTMGDHPHPDGKFWEFGSRWMMHNNRLWDAVDDNCHEKGNTELEHVIVSTDVECLMANGPSALVGAGKRVPECCEWLIMLASAARQLFHVNRLAIKVTADFVMDHLGMWVHTARANAGRFVNIRAMTDAHRGAATDTKYGRLQVWPLTVGPLTAGPFLHYDKPNKYPWKLCENDKRKKWGGSEGLVAKGKVNAGGVKILRHYPDIIYLVDNIKGCKNGTRIDLDTATQRHINLQGINMDTVACTNLVGLRYLPAEISSILCKFNVTADMLYSETGDQLRTKEELLALHETETKEEYAETLKGEAALRKTLSALAIRMSKLWFLTPIWVVLTVLKAETLKILLNEHAPYAAMTAHKCGAVSVDSAERDMFCVANMLIRLLGEMGYLDLGFNLRIGDILGAQVTLKDAVDMLYAGRAANLSTASPPFQLYTCAINTALHEDFLNRRSSFWRDAVLKARREDRTVCFIFRGSLADGWSNHAHGAVVRPNATAIFLSDGEDDRTLDEGLASIVSVDDVYEVRVNAGWSHVRSALAKAGAHLADGASWERFVSSMAAHPRGASGAWYLEGLCVEDARGLQRVVNFKYVGADDVYDMIHLDEGGRKRLRRGPARRLLVRSKLPFPLVLSCGGGMPMRVFNVASKKSTNFTGKAFGVGPFTEAVEIAQRNDVGTQLTAIAKANDKTDYVYERDRLRQKLQSLERKDFHELQERREELRRDEEQTRLRTKLAVVEDKLQHTDTHDPQSAAPSELTCVEQDSHYDLRQMANLHHQRARERDRKVKAASRTKPRLSATGTPCRLAEPAPTGPPSRPSGRTPREELAWTAQAAAKEECRDTVGDAGGSSSVDVNDPDATYHGRGRLLLSDSVWRTALLEAGHGLAAYNPNAPRDNAWHDVVDSLPNMTGNLQTFAEALAVEGGPLAPLLLHASFDVIEVADLKAVVLQSEAHQRGGRARNFLVQGPGRYPHVLSMGDNRRLRLWCPDSGREIDVQRFFCGHHNFPAPITTAVEVLPVGAVSLDDFDTRRILSDDFKDRRDKAFEGTHCPPGSDDVAQVQGLLTQRNICEREAAAGPHEKLWEAEKRMIMACLTSLADTPVPWAGLVAHNVPGTWVRDALSRAEPEYLPGWDDATIAVERLRALADQRNILLHAIVLTGPSLRRAAWDEQLLRRVTQLGHGAPTQLPVR